MGLDAVELLMEIEETFGVEIPDADAQQSHYRKPVVCLHCAGAVCQPSSRLCDGPLLLSIADGPGRAVVARCRHCAPIRRCGACCPGGADAGCANSTLRSASGCPSSG